MSTILIIDDEEKIRTLLTRILSLEGFDVSGVSDAKKAFKKLENQSFDLILCDVKLPDANGIELLKIIKEKYPLTEVILLTAYGTINDGVQAMKNGAFDYLTKADDHNRLLPLVYKAMEKIEMAKRLQNLEKKLTQKYSFDSIIGTSDVIKIAVEMAKKVAPTDASVLLTGETGTGKEVFAQAIHNASNRSRGNFVALNCSAFSKEILESELFGHKAGAFTGAIKDQKGLFEEADKGTLFLDEIGEMPIELQAKLLRVLETGEFLTIGETKVKKADVRIVAATHKTLQNDIKSGQFREDLYYRISVFEIKLPSLRERVSDIEELVYYFLKLFVMKTNKKEMRCSDEYMERLKKHTWKGNIRELRNVIERSVILTDGFLLLPDTLPKEMAGSFQNSANEDKFDLQTIEKNHIKRVLLYTNGNKTETARLLNIALTTLYRKLSEYNIA